MYKKHRILAWFVVVAWMGVIFYLSHQPANVSSKLSTGITLQFIQIIETLLPFVHLSLDTWHFLIRKSAHFIAYFLLGVFIINALYVSGSRNDQAVTTAIMISFCYAVSDEVHQLFIPGRSGEVTDVLIDTFGATSGIILFRLCLFFYFKWKKAPNNDPT